MIFYIQKSRDSRKIMSNLNSVNKTLYIPLYGKSFVSKKGVILSDSKAEEIWDKEKFELSGKSKSKWLAYEMAMRARVFDDWVREKASADEKAIILHLGCGLDSRVHRVNCSNKWFDLDFPSVIEVRKKYFVETKGYKMIDSDITQFDWLYEIPRGKNAIVVMEGLSMYLPNSKLVWLLHMLSEHFEKVDLLMDVYTPMAAKLTKWKNPINEVGVSEVYGVENAQTLECYGFKFIGEHSMNPPSLIAELDKSEQGIFKTVFAGDFAKKIQRVYEYQKI